MCAVGGAVGSRSRIGWGNAPRLGVRDSRVGIASEVSARNVGFARGRSRGPGSWNGQTSGFSCPFSLGQGGEQCEHRLRSAGRMGRGVRRCERRQSLGGCESGRSFKLPRRISVPNARCRAASGALHGAATLVGGSPESPTPGTWSCHLTLIGGCINEERNVKRPPVTVTFRGRRP